MIIIDASDAVLGRLASHVAKLALQGEQVVVLNCAKAIISGNKKQILEKYSHLRDMGGPFHGPFFPRTSERIVKRTIRGMLPHKQHRGREALKRIICYIQVPEEYVDKEAEEIKLASADRLKVGKMLKVGELSKLLGAKIIK